MIATLLLLWFMTTAQQSPPTTNDSGDLGVIKGTVVDPDGKPMEGVRVYVQGDNDPPTSRPDTATTNANGDFTLDRVQPRRVKIHAFKDSDYYGDVVFAFNNPSKLEMPEVEVKLGQTITGVIVRLMPKAAKLHLYVRDAATKELVHGIYFRLCREDNPSFCLAGSGPSDFERLVPVGVGISIKVSNDKHSQFDYQWQYRDPKTGSPYFRAKSGETETMNVYVSVPKN
jgi:hypothetical protein